MRFLPIAGTVLTAMVVAGALAVGAGHRPAAAGGPSVPATVVVELFTSEGCSSCPPADELLIELLRTQPVAGVTIVGLSEHVDYWDRLGWRDPFSSSQFTARQTLYDVASFGGKGVYTPQMMVDGRTDVVGSDRPALLRAIADAAKATKASVTVSVTREADRVAIVVDGTASPDLRHGLADVLVGVTEDELSTDVARGENGGRRLAHGAVLRQLSTAGVWKADTSFHATTSQRLDRSWQISNLRVVVLVQERQSRRIIGASTAAIQ